MASLKYIDVYISIQHVLLVDTCMHVLIHNCALTCGYLHACMFTKKTQERLTHYIS